MTVSGLVEFLLSRLAEDEAAASHIENRSIRERVLADVAAKRAIIEECRGAIRSWKTTHVVAFDHILFALAQPYSSHAEFDPSWLKRVAGAS